MTTVTETVPEQLFVDAPIHKVAAKSMCHYATAGVRVSPSENGAYLVATDGHCLAVAEATKAHITETSIIPTAVFSGRKRQHLRREGDLWLSDSDKAAPPVEGNFPKVADVIPDIDEMGCSARPRVQLTIDAGILANLAKAIGEDDKVTLWLETDEQCHVAGPIAAAGPSGFGCIMPVETNGTGSGYAKARQQFIDAQR